MAYDGRYENGNPPYSLYQGDDGLWGLVDKEGTRLPSVFNRLDEDRFLENPWEVVSFNPNVGFDLLAWCDPCEAWFNFTWDDSRYPDEFAGYLWKKPNKEYPKYEAEIRRLMPVETYWLLDCINEADRILAIDDENEYHHAIVKFIGDYPQLAKSAHYNNCLDPVMRNTNVSEDMKMALWRAKVSLDANVILFTEHIDKQDDMLNNIQFISR